MSIILDRKIVEDDWVLVPAAAKDAGAPEFAVTDFSADAKLLVPLGVWQSQRGGLIARAAETRLPLGVWLDSHEDPAALENDVQQLALIAVNFPRFTDGRGYSTAALLRSRYGFKGELRAIGEVLRDQLFYLNRVGFNAFAIREDKDIHDALNAFHDFSETYQASIDQPLPLSRRRAA